MSEQRFLDQNGVLFLWQKVKTLVEETAESMSGGSENITEEQIEEILTAAEEARKAAEEAKAAAEQMKLLFKNGNLTEDDYPYYTHVLTIYELPPVGKSNVLYIVTSTSESYIWDTENLKYVPVPHSSCCVNDIEIIDGGNA